MSVVCCLRCLLFVVAVCCLLLAVCCRCCSCIVLVLVLALVLVLVVVVVLVLGVAVVVVFLSSFVASLLSYLFVCYIFFLVLLVLAPPTLCSVGSLFQLHEGPDVASHFQC
jgi:hypothetical protein